MANCCDEPLFERPRPLRITIDAADMNPRLPAITAAHITALVNTFFTHPDRITITAITVHTTNPTPTAPTLKGVTDNVS